MKKKSDVGNIPLQNDILKPPQKAGDTLIDSVDSNFFLRIIGSIQLAIAIFNEDNEFVYINETFSSLFELELDELKKLDEWLEIACPDRTYRQAVLDLWKRCISDIIHQNKGSKNKREINLFTCSGNKKVVEITFNRILSYLVVSFEDITEKINTENKLRQQIEFSNKIALTSPVGIVTTDLNGKILFANNKAISILGTSHKKIKKLFYTIDDLKITTINGKKFREEDLPLTLVLKNLKSVFDVKHAVETSDGNKIFLQVNASPILAEENKPVGMIVVFEDITENIEAENLMMENYNFRNAILNNAAEGLCVGHECRHFPYIEFTVWNNQMEKLTGFSMNEINNRSVIDTLYPEPELKEKAIERLKMLKEGIDVQDEEWEITRKDGQKRIIKFSVTTINKNDNDPYIMALMNDVTEKRIQEEEINQKNQELKEAQRIGKIGNWIHHFSNDNVYWSDQIYRIFGYKPEEESPQTIVSRHIIENVRKEYLKLISELHGTKSDFKFKVLEFQIENKYNEKKDLVLRGEIVFDGSGSKIAAKGTLQDITETKDQELKLKELNNTKDKLFSIIAHDLKNPIGVLVSLSGLLEESIETKDFESLTNYGRIFSLSANKSYTLLINLLDWVRSQSHKINFSPEQINLIEVVEEIKNLLSVIIMEKRVTISVDINESLLVFADINMLKAILRNLISNAIKYSHPGGNIKINAKNYKKETVCISVADNGVGIPKEHQKNIFNTAQQISTHGTENEKGTGLGLLICSDFVRKHNENIWVESTYGQGSAFCFTLKKC